MSEADLEFELLPAGVLTVRQGVIVASNAAARRDLGQTLKGRPLSDLMHSPPGEAQPGGKAAPLLLRRQDGQPLAAVATFSDRPDGDVLMVFQTLANAGTGNFLASASHDLRQPLQAMALFISALEGRFGGDIGQIAEAMKSSVETMEQVFERLLDLLRLESGLFASGRDDFLASDVLQALADLGVRVVSSDVAVCSDRKLLRRILFILTRAAQTRARRVLVGCRRRGAQLWFLVRDDGPEALGRDSMDILLSPGQDLAEYKVISDKLDLFIAARLARLLGPGLAVSSRPGATCVGLGVALTSAAD